VIDLDRVSITYAGADAPVLRDVSLHIPEGELCLVIGPTGSGKSTLLALMNGLVPHFTGGHLSGRVTVGGRDTAHYPPRELADLVGVVGQDARATFVADTVTDELAYTMESLAMPRDVMRRRVEDTLDLLGIAELRDRALGTLSGGQAQRVAIGAVLTAQPRVLVLDEPTSALDPAAAEEVLAILQRLVHDIGLTVVMAEHRLERVVQYADSIVLVDPASGTVAHESPAHAMARSTIYPPVVGLGRLAGWSPLPLSIRDARRAAADLRRSLPPVPPEQQSPSRSQAGSAYRPAAPVARMENVVVRYGPLIALDGASLEVLPGEILSVMGRNGSGKSTLLNVLCGLIAPSRGAVTVAAGGDGGNGRRVDPRSLSGPALVRAIGSVPQNPGDILYRETVARECSQSDRDALVPRGTTAALLEDLAGPIAADRHPRDLSEGQRLCLALAIVLAAQPLLLLLDEPTRGLDYPAKHRLAAVLRAQADAGRAVVLATHDVELTAECSDRTVVLAQGRVIADGPSRDVATHSPVFAPQVAKVLDPLPYLTVTDIERALAAPVKPQ
jgi:energy-coupling factor transporter ATP-binding protein EcfA2